MNIAGTWKGEYTFEETTGAEAVAGHTVGFTMELKCWWLGAVSGTVQDDPRDGFKEAGTIKGLFKGRILRFRKLMPVLRMIHERKWLNLEELAERHTLVLETDKPHPPILHAGKISEDGNRIEGTWRADETNLTVPGSYKIIRIPTVGGTWWAARQ